MVQIAALIQPGTFLTSAAPLYDCFSLSRERLARTIGRESTAGLELDLTVLSADGGDVAAFDGSALPVDRRVAGTDRFDFVWLPAFRAGGEEELRAFLARSGDTIAWLRTMAERGCIIGASGSAVALPMAAGLAERLAVPVAPALAPVLRAIFPRFVHEPDREFVDHRHLLLSRGIAHDYGVVAAALARVLSAETGRWLVSVGGGAEPDETSPRDPLVEEARLRLEQRFATPVSIAGLAAELNVTHPKLIRRFRGALGTTPSAYVQQVRLAAAKRMLQFSSRTVDSIAAAVGYGDARVFRQMFRRATGWSASAWRTASRSGQLK